LEPDGGSLVSLGTKDASDVPRRATARFAAFEKTFTGFQIAISLFRADFPWLYDAGLDVARTLRINASAEGKTETQCAFTNSFATFTFEGISLVTRHVRDKEMDDW
jgi:hypothetical protein